MKNTPSLLSTLPDHARTWVFIADHSLTPQDQSLLLNALQPFLDRWASHGRRVVGEATFLHDRFLLIGAHMPVGDISGCGIDAVVHAITEHGATHGIQWLPATTITFRDRDQYIQAVARPDFRQWVRNGEVDAQTPVFDLTLPSLASYRQGNFERPLSDSWHATVFKVPMPTS